MAYGLQICDSTGVLWDSTTVSGGLVIDFREYAAGVSGETITYSAWAGRTAFLLTNGSPDIISLTTASGTPVVTVQNATFYRQFALAVL